jgi:serine phosphatase RsbU (regulator of sigma subunit)
VNRARKFFGTERLRATLAALPQDIEPAELVKRLRAEVERFADGADAADDLTLLVLRWEGPGR